MSLIKKIKEYYKKNFDKRNVLFTTPSHGQGNFIPKSAKELLGEKFFRCDFSETEGFDNLRNPNGILKALLEKFSKIYNTKQTFLLTNGSTSGVMAMMLSVLNEGDKVLVARNCHISVFNALVLTGAVPVWFVPDYDSEWGVYKGVTAANVLENLEKNEDIKAVVLTSPTYEGLFSDIAEISSVCERYDVKLLVDEAHGALLNFGDFKSLPAVLSGADMSVQSLHKTAGAPNPCALLHLSKKSSVTPEKVQEMLNLINTTSPSYPLMLACEICVAYLSSENGRVAVKKLQDEILSFKANLVEGIEIYDGFNDPTKILLKFEDVSATAVAEILNDKFHIEEEFSNEKSLLFICGIGTDKAKLKKLASCLNQIKNIGGILEQNEEKPVELKFKLPEIVFTPRQAMQKDCVIVEKSKAIGKVSAETLIEYPPGVPFVVAGETISEDVLCYIKSDFVKVIE